MKHPDLLPRLRKIAARAGAEVTRHALTLWYCALDKDTPTRLRFLIFGDLAYVINPLDVVPDVLPVVGWSDDLAVLAASVGLLAMHIKDDHRRAAADTLTRWGLATAKDR